MSKEKDISIFISLLLGHKPEVVGLKIDKHGWVYTSELIDSINTHGQYSITKKQLERIVADDSKGRYRFNEDKTKIKACQGHSIEWVEPELEYMEPPMYLYHGTTMEAYEKIKKSGAILKMKRHAVHLQEHDDKAWESARRWINGTPIVLEISAKALWMDGAEFGKTENGIWCVEEVPVRYINTEFVRQGYSYG